MQSAVTLTAKPISQLLAWRVARLPLPTAVGDRVMGVQAFRMCHAQPEARNLGLFTQHAMQAAGGIFAEHQILSVGQGKGLLVGTLDCRLQGGAERLFAGINQGKQG